MAYRVVLADSAKADAYAIYVRVVSAALHRGPLWFEELMRRCPGGSWGWRSPAMAQWKTTPEQLNRSGTTPLQQAKCRQVLRAAIRFRNRPHTTISVVPSRNMEAGSGAARGLPGLLTKDSLKPPGSPWTWIPIRRSSATPKGPFIAAIVSAKVLPPIRLKRIPRVHRGSRHWVASFVD